MKNINFIIAVILVMVFSSCRSSTPVTGFITAHDTIARERIVTYRDTVLITDQAAVTLVTHCNDISETPTVKQDKNAKLTLSKKPDGTLTADCQCDTLTIKAKLKEELQRETHTKVSIETKIQKEKYIPGWANFLAWTGGILLLLILGIIIIIIYKNFK